MFLNGAIALGGVGLAVWLSKRSVRAAWRQLRELEWHATRDAVTGLPNRWVLDEALDRELGRSRRHNTPLSMVLLDVDGFKRINDVCGHAAGDSVLRQIADALAANTKSYDLAARYGGDEFAVLLPGCSRLDAFGLAERLRAAALDALNGDGPTLSAGVATVPDDADDGASLLRAADDALYRSKRAGRDCTTARSVEP